MIRRAKKKDLSDLKAFLIGAGLETEGISEETIEFFLLLEREDHTWEGALGIVPFGKNGLLRSMVVTSANPEQYIFLLMEQALALAKEQEMEHLFLATKKGAASFFRSLGFQIIDKSDLPEEFLLSNYIKQIFHVDNSVFLKLSL